MLNDLLKEYHLILASGSPRRHEFFKMLGLNFEIRLKPVEEIYPNELTKSEITDYLAQLKAQSLRNDLKPKDILVTSDTIVWHNNKAIGKPKNEQDAFNMIMGLSNDTHLVISSVTFTTIQQQITINTTTKVTFTALTEEEVWYYVNTFKPLDKAGAYGIQEWIGAVAISKVEGSYNNVVGLPTHLLYKTLKRIVDGK
ncbi:Maf family nucleotide pyrophosphatase [Winogradskyella immobilis]|uniref:dTTP/UTP pyrophosphatase n=1 Tax=Winogradskyella immobilis TaxID=2816852 RepID=A0ABS8EML1_9FLAO|nr:Maf family nucleotide pyrophosphatase [Winogradskyella immobilis]MCC1484266.1 septum formation protein Maf [Winogradskyella immobilis]MCG0016358.1 Maf family nucleotide pyrophosphatase [Winogradskyella immobilis]